MSYSDEEAKGTRKKAAADLRAAERLARADRRLYLIVAAVLALCAMAFLLAID